MTCIALQMVNSGDSIVEQLLRSLLTGRYMLKFASDETQKIIT